MDSTKPFVCSKSRRKTSAEYLNEKQSSIGSTLIPNCSKFRETLSPASIFLVLVSNSFGDIFCELLGNKLPSFLLLP